MYFSISDVLTASFIRAVTFIMLIALMMGAVSISETLVNLYKITWHNIPEDSHLYWYFLVAMLCGLILNELTHKKLLQF
jgi:hypothetical protein